MMKKLFFLSLNFILLTACASKSDVSNIQIEVENLQSAVLENSLRINNLENGTVSTYESDLTIPSGQASIQANSQEIVIPHKEVEYAGAQTPEDDIPLSPAPVNIAPTNTQAVTQAPQNQQALANQQIENQHNADIPLAPSASEELALILPTHNQQEPLAGQSQTNTHTQNVQTPPKKAPTPTTIAGLTQNEAYQAALNLYRTRRYADALKAFDLFLKTYPSSSYVANAIYWKGECYYAEENFSEAILAFKDVLARFPQSSKSADSLLKIALTYARLGDYPNSSLHTTVLYEDWPNSEAAKKAQQLKLQPL